MPSIFGAIGVRDIAFYDDVVVISRFQWFLLCYHLVFVGVVHSFDSGSLGLYMLLASVRRLRPYAVLGDWDLRALFLCFCRRVLCWVSLTIVLS